MSTSTPFSPLGSKAIFVALSVSSAIAQADEVNCNPDDSSANSVPCQQEQRTSNEIELIEVYGMDLSPYRAERSGDQRRIADLLDTPQTLTILTQTQILDSGKSDLKEILSAQSGVTLGTGENGNAFGDRYIIRGHEARSDIFVDGLRDPGMTTRESFATEQIEITKGPSSTFAGRGSSGGAVNSITKQATVSQSFNRLDIGLGTDDYNRTVLDVNRVVGDDSAVRLNLLQADETVPNREGIERERSGALLSGYVAPTEKLSFVADAYYLKADDVPDLGSYFDSDTREPISDIPVYAQLNDFLSSEISAVTLRTEYELSENLSFYNATRWGKTSNGYKATGARATTRDESDAIAPGVDAIRLSTHQGWQEVDYVASQFNLFWDTSLAGMKNTWVMGVEYSDEKVENGQYDITYNGTTNCSYSARGGVRDGYCATDADGNILTSVRSLTDSTFEKGSQDSDFHVETTALYAMNTVEVSDNWEVFFGLRQDWFDYDNVVTRNDVSTEYDYSDNFLNGHLGVVYKLNDSANVYASFSTATNINGGESDVGSSCGYGGLCGSAEEVSQSDPEQVKNIELGTKFQLFDDRLLATAAIFHITKSDVMESVGDDYSTLGTLNTGENEVQGLELSLVGAITDELSVQMSATTMESEVVASYDVDAIGLSLSNFAKHSLYLQLRYQPSDNIAFGGAYTYQSEMYGGQPDTAANFDAEAGQYTVEVPEYGVFDLFANYYYSEDVNFRLNIGNVTDKEYWTAAYRSGSFMYLGEARNIRASVTVNF